MSRYLVAIVGRPNVGKSTLFNRIVGHREAIVHDRPGVTRDRNYGDAEWAGLTFTLIDTGGYVPKSPDVIEQAIREQAEVAMEESDAVIFLVDASEGLTHLDREIADVLRRSGRKPLLVVNKVDSSKRESELAQFFELGFGDPIPLSAYLGRKVGDFLDVLVKDIPKQGTPGNDVRLKLAVVGRPNVGKSSFVNALVGKERSIVTELPGTTRDPVDTLLRYHGEEILLVDTAGLRRRSRVKESIEFFSTIRTIKSIERCDLAVVLVDGELGMDKQDLRIIESIIVRRRPVLIAVNKWDLVAKDENTALHVERTIQAMLRRYSHIPVMFISAKTKQRVLKVVEMAKQMHGEMRKRIPTNKLNKVLLEEIRRKPPSSPTGKEIKIKYVTQVESAPPAFSFFVNEPKLVDERYKRFVESLIRKHYHFYGIPLTLHFRKKSR